MQNIQYILSLAASAMGLLITTLTFAVKFIKNAKAKTAANRLLDLSKAILPYIEKAEEFIGYSGEEKKEYVLTQSRSYAIEHGIPFDSGAVSAQIEELVQFSKNVNKRMFGKKEEQKTEILSEPVANQTTVEKFYI